MKKILLIIAGVVVIALIGCGMWLGLKGIGTGGGNGEGTQNLTNLLGDTKEKEEDVKTAIVIKVEESEIFVDDEQCADVDELKERISQIEAKDKSATFTFEHEYAIKATYDEVKKALTDLEEILNIQIDFNE